MQPRRKRLTSGEPATYFSARRKSYAKVSVLRSWLLFAAPEMDMRYMQEHLVLGWKLSRIRRHESRKKHRSQVPPLPKRKDPKIGLEQRSTKRLFDPRLDIGATPGPSSVQNPPAGCNQHAFGNLVNSAIKTFFYPPAILKKALFARIEHVVGCARIFRVVKPVVPFVHRIQ